MAHALMENRSGLLVGICLTRADGHAERVAALALIEPYVWSARNGLAARALEVTLLTRLRTGEVIGAKWAEIDLEHRIWVIPVEWLKDRRTRIEPHRVPLSREVVATFEGLPRLGDHVFAGVRTSKPLSSMAVLSTLKDMNRDLSGQPIWVDPKSGRANVSLRAFPA